MQTRQIGRSELRVAPLAFGGNVFGWTLDEAGSFAMLDAFVDAGFNLVDTADVYSRWVPGHRGGESETVIGNWFAHSGKRAKVVLATKCGKDMGDGRKGLSARYIEQAVDASLRRLQTDYIDLLQAHDDDRATPLEETLGAFDKLIRAGKVRAIGASNYTAARLAEALRVSRDNGLARYESLQPLYNLYDRAVFERELQAVCEREELGVLPFFALAAGFLTGKYRSEADLAGRARSAMVKDKLNPRGFAILDALDKVAARLGSTPASVAIAWLMQCPTVTAPIASATQAVHLEALIAATRLQLDADALRLLDEASRE
jgi:aryl-alcohol dehydrogenase-like predicted oxidoreductase